MLKIPTSFQCGELSVARRDTSVHFVSASSIWRHNLNSSCVDILDLKFFNLYLVFLRHTRSYVVNQLTVSQCLSSDSLGRTRGPALHITAHLALPGGWGCIFGCAHFQKLPLSYDWGLLMCIKYNLVFAPINFSCKQIEIFIEKDETRMDPGFYVVGQRSTNNPNSTQFPRKRMRWGFFCGDAPSPSVTRL